MAVGGSKPAAGTVSMLASKFARLGSPKQVKSQELVKAVEGIVEATKQFDNAKLLELASLLIEAEAAENIDEFQSIGERMNKLVGAVPGEFVNQAKAIAETIPVFNWRVLPSGARDFVKGCQESTQFYLNRVMTEAKQKNQKTEWPSAFYHFFEVILKECSGSQEANVIAPAPQKAPVVAKAPTSQEPKVELQGNRWIVEKGFKASKPVVIKAESIAQGVIIEGCESVRVKVEGKVTLVSVNKCKRVQVEVDDIVSNIEVMSSINSVFILLGKVPTVVLDSSEGIKLNLNEASREVQVLTSKCAEVNLAIKNALVNKAIGGEEAEELAEIALPFQFKSVLNADGTVSTEPVKHAGA